MLFLQTLAVQLEFKLVLFPGGICSFSSGLELGLIAYLLLLEWQGISCLRLFSSICKVWLKDPSNSCTVTLSGPLKERTATTYHSDC